MYVDCQRTRPSHNLSGTIHCQLRAFRSEVGAFRCGFGVFHPGSGRSAGSSETSAARSGRLRPASKPSAARSERSHPARNLPLRGRERPLLSAEHSERLREHSRLHRKFTCPYGDNPKIPRPQSLTFIHDQGYNRQDLGIRGRSTWSCWLRCDARARGSGGQGYAPGFFDKRRKNIQDRRRALGRGLRPVVFCHASIGALCLTILLGQTANWDYGHSG